MRNCTNVDKRSMRCTGLSLRNRTRRLGLPGRSSSWVVVRHPLAQRRPLFADEVHLRALYEDPGRTSLDDTLERVGSDGGGNRVVDRTEDQSYVGQEFADFDGRGIGDVDDIFI